MMKYYLVGGAVRDKLLDYPVVERDWVVVGADEKTMLAQGFRRVGKDFPVFLHPETKEEYALARTERKRGRGYTGFSVDVNKHITLEQDLFRRDLTINAIAMDEQGRLIDPYGGGQDLSDKILRHVSTAFAEDPVRILRLARFKARYHHLGFTIAPETMLLMKSMVKRGEVEYLVSERVWKEFERSLSEKNPEEFIKTLRACGALALIMPEIDALFGVPNPPQHHPEIDSGVHSLMVLVAACRLSKDATVRFAALVHDLGKALTPMEQWPSHRGHDESGVAVIERFCHRLRIPKAYKNLAVMASKLHILIHKFNELNPSARVATLEQGDAFKQFEQFEQLLQVCEADSKGRLHAENKTYKQAEHWLRLLSALSQVDAQQIIAEGYRGLEIKEQLHQRRVVIAKLRNSDEA